MESYAEKLEWARKHLDALNADMTAFVKNEAYGAVGQFDPKTRQLTIRFRINKAFPPDWPLRVGDIVHNMRSALDSLVYALAFKYSGKPTDEQARDIQFLICDGPTEFAKRAPRWHGRMSPAAQNAIALVQPYQRRKAGAKNELSVLRDLSNIDKHRHILPCFVAGSGRVVAQIERLGGGPPLTLGPPKAVSIKGRLQNDTILGVINVPPGIDPLLDVAKKADIAIDIALDEPAAGYAGISTVLGLIESDVRQVVFPALEPHLK